MTHLCPKCKDREVESRRPFCDDCVPRKKHPRGITYRRCNQLWGICKNLIIPVPHACHKNADAIHDCICFRKRISADDWATFKKKPEGAIDPWGPEWDRMLAGGRR